MTPTTHPPQMLDRSALTTRYNAACASGNDPQATAILAVLAYLDHRSRGGVMATRRRPYSAMAEQVGALLRLYWWWAAPVLTTARQSSRPVAERWRQRCGGQLIRTQNDARPAGSQEQVCAHAA